MDERTKLKGRLLARANPGMDDSLPKNFTSKDDLADPSISTMPSTTPVLPQGRDSRIYDQDMDPRAKLYNTLLNKNLDPISANPDYMQQVQQARENAARNQFGALMAQTTSKMGAIGGERADVANFQPLIQSVYNRDLGTVPDLKLLDQRRKIGHDDMKRIELEMKIRDQEQRARLAREKSDLAQKSFDLQSQSQEERRRANRAKEGLQRDKLEKEPSLKDEKPSSQQETAALQASVAVASLPELERMENEGYRPGARVMASSWLGQDAGNYVLDAKDQNYRTLTKAVIEQLLRASSGANAPENEIRSMMQTYATLPGDKNETIATKQKLRRVYIQGLIDKAGKAARGKGMPASQGARPKNLIRQQYNPKVNKTRKFYDDGTSVELDGNQTE